MTGRTDAPPAQTIFALSSGPGPSGVAVIRLSGPAAGAALTALAGRLPPPRLATLARLRDPAGDLLDEALVLYFAAGASFTGEEVVELQVHGGRAVVRAILKVLTEMPGLRFAAPGEFARRAFDNGRLDLPQVEALAALVAAESEGQRRQALRGTSGALGQRVELWRSWLLERRRWSQPPSTSATKAIRQGGGCDPRAARGTPAGPRHVLATANRGAS